MISTPVLLSLLALSEASMNLLQNLPTQSRSTSVEGLSGQDIQMGMTTVGFVHALNRTKNYITNMHVAWSSERAVNKELLEALTPQTSGRDLNSAIYWLFIRQGVLSSIEND